MAGLSCARSLHKHGLSFTILEKAGRPGGRIKTDRIEGFQLDHGFQVLQTGYPGISDYLDLDQLKISRFPAGVAIRHDDRFHVVADPRHHPRTLYSTITAPIGTLGDRMRLLKLVGSLVRHPMEKIFEDPEEPAIDFLRKWGFSQRFIEIFFMPFFAGACLDRSMTGSSRVLKYVTRLFSNGDATLPAEGMGAIALQLASSLPDNCIRYNQEVVSVQEGAVTLADGNVIEAQKIVVAVSQPVCAALLQLDVPVQSVGEACVYFSAEWRPPIQHPFLVLNGESEGLVNNVAFPSLVAPGYAPPGKTLIAAVVLGEQNLHSDRLEDLVRIECAEWFGEKVNGWEHLKTYTIRHALPNQAPPTSNPFIPPEQHSPGIRICGEHNSLPGLQWALMSGAMAGNSIVNGMGKRTT